eukprot:8280_1
MTEWIGMEYGQYVGTLETYKKMLEQVDLTLQDNDDKSGATQYAEIFDTTLGFPKDWSFVNPNTTPDSQKEKMTIVLVVIKGKHVKKYIDARKMRMPSGNEIGANKEWIPGGYLPTGKPEAVIDAIPKNDVQLYKIYEKGKFLSNQYDAFPYTRKPIQPVDPCKENKLPPSATFYISDCAQYIKGLDKKKRPEPQTYFSEEQYNAHLQQFVEKGAAYITRQHQMEHYNYDMCIVGWDECDCTNWVGRKTNQFISPESTYRSLLDQVFGGDGEAKYRDTFDKTLGFARHQSMVNKKDVEIIFIVLEKISIQTMISNKKLRMATGNEDGVNSEWIPGGYLPTGLPEAVVDAIPKDKIKIFKIFGKMKFIKPIQVYKQFCFAPEPQQPSPIEVIVHPRAPQNPLSVGRVGAAGVTGSQAAQAATASIPRRILKSSLNLFRKCIGFGCLQPKGMGR